MEDSALDHRAHFQPQYQNQAQPIQPQHAQSGQYLLAAFALFSFFNSPGSFSASRSDEGSHSHSHSGAVLGPTSVPSAPVDETWNVGGFRLGWRDALGILHLIISALLLVSIVVPWVPQTLRIRVSRLVPSPLKPFLGVLDQSTPAHKMADETRETKEQEVESEVKSEAERARTALLCALQLRYGHPHASRPSTQEAEALRDALGVSDGIVGLASSVVRLCGLGLGLVAGKGGGLERKMLEQKAWVRLAQLVALNRASLFSTA